MSIKTTHQYICNICNNEIPKDELNHAFGCNFLNSTIFNLDSYNTVDTEGTHICVHCAIQLKEQFEMPKIANKFKNIK